MADKLHRFGTGQVSEQLMGTPLDDDMVGMLAENETNICKQHSNPESVLVKLTIENSPSTYHRFARS